MIPLTLHSSLASAVSWLLSIGVSLIVVDAIEMLDRSSKLTQRSAGIRFIIFVQETTTSQPFAQAFALQSLLISFGYSGL
jgi:hypothetical protein